MYYFHLTPCDQQQMKHQTLWKPITTPCFQALLEQNTNLLPSLEADTSFSMEYRRAKTANAIRRLRKELMYKYRVKSSAETCLATIEDTTTTTITTTSHPKVCLSDNAIWTNRRNWTLPILCSGILLGRMGKNTSDSFYEIMTYTQKEFSHNKAVAGKLKILRNHNLWLEPEKCKFWGWRSEICGSDHLSRPDTAWSR